MANCHLECALAKIVAHLGQYYFGPEPVVVNSEIAVLPLVKSALLVVVVGMDGANECVSAFLLNADGAVVSMFIRASDPNSDLLVLKFGVQQQIEERIVRSSLPDQDPRTWAKFSILKPLRQFAMPSITPYLAKAPILISTRSAVLPLQNNRVMTLGIRTLPTAFLHKFDCAIISPSRGGLVVYDHNLDATDVRDFFHQNLNYILVPMPPKPASTDTPA